MKTASIRQLRTEFPKVRAAIAREGEIVVTERGQAAYVIKPYVKAKKRDKNSKPIDYYARLVGYMPKPLSAQASKELDELNRGDR